MFSTLKSLFKTDPQVTLVKFDGRTACHRKPNESLVDFLDRSHEEYQKYLGMK